MPVPTPITPRLPPPVRLQFWMPAPWIFHLCPRYNHLRDQNTKQRPHCVLLESSQRQNKKKLKDSTAEKKKDWKEPEPSTVMYNKKTVHYMDFLLAEGRREFVTKRPAKSRFYYLRN